MRLINSHKAVDSEPIDVFCLDEPGPGGANHKYHVTCGVAGSFVPVNINFQKGPILENGVNGVTQEVLLAIVKDRLEGFQSGAFANANNQLALEYVNLALTCLKERTLERIARNVEGKSIL